MKKDFAILSVKVYNTIKRQVFGQLKKKPINFIWGK